MNIPIHILPRSDGGTEFLPRPHRLHLGARQAQGVDTLCFVLPPDWAGRAVALYIRHQDGTLAAPIALDPTGRVPVDRRFTGWHSGQWMLAVTGPAGYAAYTRPGSYDVGETLSLEGETQPDPSPSLYEQFVAQVLESASQATGAAGTAVQAARQAETAAARSDGAARQAQEAAARAEAIAPAAGAVLSVNGKGGAVVLTPQDLGALPCPDAPRPGELLRVSALEEGGGLRLDTVPPGSALHTDPAYGLDTRPDGTLATAAATQSQLEAMEDLYAPLTPGRTPYAVKQVLTAFAPGWTAEEKTAIRAALGAAEGTDSPAWQALDRRLARLEWQLLGQPIQYRLDTLAGLTVSGSWNEAQARLEF